MFEQRKEAPYSERLSKGVGLDDKMVYVYRTKCLRRISRDASVCWRGGMLLSKGIDLGNSLSRLAGGDSGMEQPHPMSCRDRIPPLQKYSNLGLNQFHLLLSIKIPLRAGTIIGRVDWEPYASRVIVETTDVIISMSEFTNFTINICACTCCCYLFLNFRRNWFRKETSTHGGGEPTNRPK